MKFPSFKNGIRRIPLEFLPFADAANTYSDDRMTYTNGGEMPEFTSGRFNITFESQVFGIQKDSSFSKPFETEFGYHRKKTEQYKATHQL